jgi:hypothetical protein
MAIFSPWARQDSFDELSLAFSLSPVKSIHDFTPLRFFVLVGVQAGPHGYTLSHSQVFPAKGSFPINYGLTGSHGRKYARAFREPPLRWIFRPLGIVIVDPDHLGYISFVYIPKTQKGEKNE